MNTDWSISGYFFLISVHIAFQPTLMDKHPEHGKTQVTQKYFSGGHGGVGCGDGAELLCSDITLRFVLEEIERRGLKLAFDPSKVPSMPDVTTEGDPITRSFPKNVFFWALGKHIRPIQAIEDIHETAIVRYQNVKKWRPQALNPFQKTLSNKITDTQSSHQKNALSQAVKS